MAKKKKSPKTSERKKPSKRQSAYAVERVLHPAKSKRQAALDAGYAPSVADKAGELIEDSRGFRENFQAAIRERISAEKVAQRVAEGLDAMETKLFTFEGQISDQRDLIAWSERRQYAELAAKFGGYYNEKIELAGAQDVEVRVRYVGE